MLKLDYKDTSPIYQQIKEKTKMLIISGVLAENERIPSVRELAVAMTINPNTIQRAYKELEAEGYIYSQRAKGYYVAPSENAHLAVKTEPLIRQFEKIVSEMLFVGIPYEKLTGITEKIYNGGNNK